MKKCVSFLMVPIFTFSMAMACTPQQTATAKQVYTKISFYSNLARSMIKVAELHYQDNAKVATALAATRASLVTLETLVAAIEAGTTKDESGLALALGELVGNVFVLIEAIRQAKSVKSTAS